MPMPIVNYKNIAKLKEQWINLVLPSKEFKEELSSATEEIIEGAKAAGNEATIEGIFERVIYGLLKVIHIPFHPEKEVYVETRRHTARGKMDSRIGAVVIEYKHKSKLSSESDILSAQQQLKSYTESLSKKLKNEIVGFLTDGLSIFEQRTVDGQVVAESTKQKLNADNLLRFIQTIVSLEETALNSENLIKDFCGASYKGVLFKLARILNNILATKSTPKTSMLRIEWEELFRLAHDDQSQQKRIAQRREALSEIFGEKLDNSSLEYQGLFALHTAYAIILKLIAYRVVSDVKFGAAMQNYKALIKADTKVLRAFCSDLEDGEIFRKLGILNLLEGDFFSWYSDPNQWNEDLYNALQEILESLGRYENVSKIFSKVTVIDLFRELYEATVPQVVRASFGEFYTPFWLADHVLESSKLNEGWRVLDPCCGSGTFIIAAISRIREENKHLNKEDLLKKILNKVVGMDLNPLAVLTTRIHYFIHISDLLPDDPRELVIPVFLGDSSYVPEEIKIAGIKCLAYSLKTIKKPITIKFPMSLVNNTPRFVSLMYEYENLVRETDVKSASKLLIDSLGKNDNKPEIRHSLIDLTSQLVKLEEKKWNGIWARIITNLLTTACLNKFTNIVGNPPWVDWKNLPAGYRDKVKSLCIDKGLFSGAGQTGGINLNICALITHVAATNWLSKKGRLAFLMPKELAYQASYEGWRKSVGGASRCIMRLYDWSKAGDPFDPVKEDFMTFVIGPKEPKKDSVIPVKIFIKKRHSKGKAHSWETIKEAMENLDEHSAVAGQIIADSTIYTFAKNKDHLLKFRKIAGQCEYIGREGIEFYPQELLIFKYHKKGPRSGTVFLKNIQVQKSKYKIPQQTVLLETKFLFPLAKGKEIESFKHNYKGFIVPFPYYASEPRKPLDTKALKRESRWLLDYYRKYEKIIRAQTPFSDKIRGPNAGEFYGLARTGKYTFRDVHVAFRDNTKWRAAVITSHEMPWGEKKRLLFQNHAVSMCERVNGDGYITLDEAHYICAILNVPIVEEFILASSDTRSFKIRPPIYVPLFDFQNKDHLKLSKLSKMAYRGGKKLQELKAEAEKLYLKICGKKDI
jgi:ribosomal protein S17E